MSLIKEHFIPTLIILVASAIVILAALPAANTDWAEGIRSNSHERHERGEAGQEFEEGEGGEGSEGRPRPSGVLMIVGPLIKVTILMGIGGLLTALVLWIIRLVSGGRKRVPQGGG